MVEDWALAPDSPDERKYGLKRVLTYTKSAVITLERGGHYLERFVQLFRIFKTG